MALFDEIARYYKTGSFDAPAPPQPNAYQGTPADKRTDQMKLDLEALGSDNPQQYGGTFNQAYKNLGQPGEGHEGVIGSGTQELADAFIDRFHEKNGSLPTAAQVKDFVSSNLDSGYASNYIKGTLNRDQIKSQMVDPYVQANGLGQGPDQTGVTQRMNDLNSKLEQYYGGASQYAQDAIDREYNKQKINVANDLAGAGVLSSGVSRYSLNDLEGQRGQANASAQASLASQKAAGQVDLSKTIENILAGQRGLQQGANQFQQNLQFSKNQYQNQQDLQNRQLDLASQLGKAQANANQSGPLDYAGLALGGLGALGSFGQGLPGLAGGIANIAGMFKKKGTS